MNSVGLRGMTMRRCAPFLLHLAHAVLCERPGAAHKGGRALASRNARVRRGVASQATSSTSFLPARRRRSEFFGEARPTDFVDELLADTTSEGPTEPKDPLEKVRYEVRQAAYDDIASIQICNRASLPENYGDLFYSRHLTEWGDISFVAHAADEQNVAAYILGRVDDNTDPTTPDEKKLEGHITSLAVLDSCRRRGLAKRLLLEVHRAMLDKRGVERIRLHVRCSNTGAMQLYSALGYTIITIVEKYYEDGEAAFLMAAQLKKQRNLVQGS